MNIIYWLALGAFAGGTEAFMVAAILPEIFADLGGERALGWPLCGYIRVLLSGQFADLDGEGLRASKLASQLCLPGLNVHPIGRRRWDNDGS